MSIYRLMVAIFEKGVQQYSGTKWKPSKKETRTNECVVHTAATKLVPALRKLDYGQIVQKLELTTLHGDPKKKR